MNPSGSTDTTVPVILDTDMGNDIDDALALAMLHALQSRGECRLLGVTVSKGRPSAAAYVDVVNTFYRRGHIPVGAVEDGPTPEPSVFADPIVNERADVFPRTAKEYPSAVPLLRRLLAKAEDHSVTVVMIGFSTNMARLLDTAPDATSGLDGMALFERKVSRVVMMAGEFSPKALVDPASAKEFNVVKDVASAQRFIARCPSPIVFTGFEVGLAIPYPAASVERDFAWAAHHPVAEAYRLFKPMPYDRPSWDLTAVLYAVRRGQGYFGESEPGTAHVSDDGALHFAPSPAGRCRYLTIDEPRRVRIDEAHVQLVTQPTDSASRTVSRTTLAPPRPPISISTSRA